MAPNAGGTHPREVLFDAAERHVELPACDHYAGVEKSMCKSLALQAELGPVFDVTLDGEDGAPAGGEIEQAHLIAELAMSADNRFGRVGTRLVPFGHPAFDGMLRVLLRDAGTRLAYLTVPKVRDAQEWHDTVAALENVAAELGLARLPPLHALIETHGALRDVQRIAAHPRVECLSFGLMDFVSAHRGAIPASAMGAEGQFAHPLVTRAKLEIAAACHARAIVPSHCVVTEFKELEILRRAAARAAREFGYLRMWSIHPAQIRVIVDAFAPDAAEVERAADILQAAERAGWAPIAYRHGGREQLHDRASYRYFWQVLERAHRVCLAASEPGNGYGSGLLPTIARERWFSPAGNS